MLDQHRRGEPFGLSPVEDGGGDVWSEVGEAQNLAEIGAVQLLALGQIGKSTDPTADRRASFPQIAAGDFDIAIIGQGANPRWTPTGGDPGCRCRSYSRLIGLTKKGPYTN